MASRGPHLTTRRGRNSFRKGYVPGGPVSSRTAPCCPPGLDPDSPA